MFDQKTFSFTLKSHTDGTTAAPEGFTINLSLGLNQEGIQTYILLFAVVV